MGGCEVRCRRGYELVRNTLRCTASGDWAGVARCSSTDRPHRNPDKKRLLAGDCQGADSDSSKADQCGVASQYVTKTVPTGQAAAPATRLVPIIFASHLDKEDRLLMELHSMHAGGLHATVLGLDRVQKGKFQTLNKVRAVRELLEKAASIGPVQGGGPALLVQTTS